MRIARVVVVSVVLLVAVLGGPGGTAFAQSDPGPSGTPYPMETPSPSAAPEGPGGEGEQPMGPMSATSRPSEISNGHSYLPTVSSDGRYVAFESEANNLTSNDFNSNTDVFVRDLNTRVATLVSTTGGGSTSGSSYAPSISSNGRYVAFHSFANLVGSDTNGTADIYLRDLQQGQTRLVSVSSSGGLANGVSDHPQVTPDGRYVAFRSFANNLVANDTNGQPDIFLRDLQTNTTQRVSLSANGDQANGYTERRVSISADGRFVAFETQSSNMVFGDNNGDWDVFVRDRAAGTTYLVSVVSGGSSGNLGSYYPSMTPDGRYVVFHAWASNLVANDNNGLPDIFIRDRQTNTTTLVSQVNGSQTNGISDTPTVSPDGRYVAFRSWSNNLILGGDSNGVPDAYLKDLITGSLTIISNTGAQANAESGFPVVVGGPTTVFQTLASNLVPGDNNGKYDIVIRTPAGLRGVTVMPNSAPTASLTVSPTSGDRSTSFQATVTGSDPNGDPITSYQVSWGDGRQSFGPNPTHSYTGTGNFTVTAVVCDQFSACSNPSNPVTVNVAFSNRAPVASLNVSPSQGDLRTTFAANMNGTFDPDGDPLSYSIDWGDGAKAESFSATHTYQLPGDYEVRGTATDAHGGKDTVAMLVKVCATSADPTCQQIPKPPEPCASPQMCQVEDAVSGVQNVVRGVDPCERAEVEGACTTVSESVGRVQDAVPEVNAPLAVGDRTFAVLTANVQQAFGPRPHACQDSPPDPYREEDKHKYHAEKDCNPGPRAKAFARRVSALTGGTGTDRLPFAPDVILLQEARRQDAETIRKALNNKFDKRNYKIAVGKESDDGTVDRGTTDDGAEYVVQFETAILYASLTVAERDEKPKDGNNYIETGYTKTEQCTHGPVYVDSDLDYLDDCKKIKRKRHAIASFKKKLPGNDDPTLGVVSAHFVPPDHLTGSDDFKDTIFKRWADRLEDVELVDYFEGMDAYVIGGDFNQSRCKQKYDDVKEKKDCEKRAMWEEFFDLGYVDSVYRIHGVSSTQKELTNQYRDGIRANGNTNYREKRVDMLWVNGAKPQDASHDLSCGLPGKSCDYLDQSDRYSDHRLVWTTFTPSAN